MKVSYHAKYAAIALATTLFSGLVQAQSLEQISVRGGTLGLGGEIGFKVVPTVVLRAIGQAYNYDYSHNMDNINYKGQLKLGSAGAQLDFHPPLLPFYATAGIYANGNKIDMAAQSASSYTIGSHTYTPAQIGTLNAKATYNKAAFYGGIGAEMGIGPVNVVAEGGIYYQGKPDVTIAASGPIASNSIFNNDVSQELVKYRKDLKDTEYWPALTLMARWKF